MFMECVKNNGTDYLRLVQAVRVTNKKSYKVSQKKVLQKDCVNQKTGEVIQSSDIKAFIDFDKVAEYRKSMGYYQIVTSELTLKPLEVIDQYHGLTQISA